MSRERAFLDPKVILDAAIQVIEREGFKKLSTRKIAAQLGVSVMTLYNYYENREAILKASILRGFSYLNDGFLEKIQPYLCNPALNPLRLFFVVSEHLLEFALTRPRLFEFLFRADLQPHQKDPRVAAFYGFSYSHIRKRILDESREDEVHRKVYIFEVLMGGLARNVLKGRGDMTPERYRLLMEEAYDSLLRPLEPLVRSGDVELVL